MKSSDVEADLIFLGNRVISFNISTNTFNAKAQAVNVSFDFDYNLKELRYEDGNSFGRLEYAVKVKATVKKKMLFKIDLLMEGIFKSETLSKEDFKNMVEVNGLITLSHISRAYILSVSAQSGINLPVRVPMVNINKLIEQKQKELQQPK